MKLISCEKLEKSMVELQFSIDAETFKDAVAKAFKRESKKYAVPGFRKGKAPRAMIEKMYGADLFQYDAVNDLFPAAYEEAVKEAGIEVVSAPQPEVVSMNEADGAVLKVKVAVSSRSSMSLAPSLGTQDTSLGASATGAGGSGGVGCGIGIARRHQKREQCET